MTEEIQVVADEEPEVVIQTKPTRRRKASKAAENLPAEATAPVEDHPNKVYDNSVYRWIGHNKHKRMEKIIEKHIIMGAVKDVVMGEKEVIEQYEGVCAGCKIDLYDLIEGPGNPGIGRQLVSYNTGASGEMPSTFCQVCDPSKGLQRSGIPEGAEIPGEAWSMRT